MQLEKIKFEGKARECNGYILDIDGDDTFGFNTVEDIEEFVNHYHWGLIADTQYGYDMCEQPNGIWLKIRAYPRFEKDGFKVHGLEEHHFYGYYDHLHGRRVDGWYNPYFEIDEALKIAEAAQKELGQSANYDETTDTFTFIIEEDDYGPQKYQGVDIQDMHLYPIGEDEWTWNLWWKK